MFKLLPLNHGELILDWIKLEFSHFIWMLFNRWALLCARCSVVKVDTNKVWHLEPPKLLWQSIYDRDAEETNPVWQTDITPNSSSDRSWTAAPPGYYRSDSAWQTHVQRDQVIISQSWRHHRGSVTFICECFASAEPGRLLSSHRADRGRHDMTFPLLSQPVDKRRRDGLAAAAPDSHRVHKGGAQRKASERGDGLVSRIDACDILAVHSRNVNSCIIHMQCVNLTSAQSRQLHIKTGADRTHEGWNSLCQKRSVGRWRRWIQETKKIQQAAEKKLLWESLQTDLSWSFWLMRLDSNRSQRQTMGC